MPQFTNLPGPGSYSFIYNVNRAVTALSQKIREIRAGLETGEVLSSRYRSTLTSVGKGEVNPSSSKEEHRPRFGGWSLLGTKPMFPPRYLLT